MRHETGKSTDSGGTNVQKNTGKNGRLVFFAGDAPGQGYTPFSTAYSGMPQVIRPDGLYRANTRFGLYRWHITDPIRFEHDLKVTVQDLGWKSEQRYLIQQSDITSVAFWYQTRPSKPFLPLGTRDEIAVL